MFTLLNLTLWVSVTNQDPLPPVPLPGPHMDTQSLGPSCLTHLGTFSLMFSLPNMPRLLISSDVTASLCPSKAHTHSYQDTLNLYLFAS